MAVHKKESCNGNLGERWHKDDKKVWRKNITGFSADKEGRAAGMIFDLESGYDSKDNEDKVLVIYGPKKDGSSEIKKIGCGKLEYD